MAAALERQNAKLKADVADLRELVRLQGKLTHGGEFTRSSIEAAIRSLTKTAVAKLDAEGRQQLSGMLKDFYKYIATDKELAWEGVAEKAGQIADFLMDNVTIKPQRDAYADDILRYLRGTKIKLSDSQRAEVEKLYGYDNYRKMLFGAGVRISRCGFFSSAKKMAGHGISVAGLCDHLEAVFFSTEVFLSAAGFLLAAVFFAAGFSALGATGFGLLGSFFSFNTTAVRAGR